jgi:hypothetical protein
MTPKRKLYSLIHAPLACCLKEIGNFCLESDPPRSGAPTQWPDGQFLERLSEAIRLSASLYSRGRGTIWDCVKALENRRTSLKLQKRIEDLVRRAARQGLGDSFAAKERVAASALVFWLARIGNPPLAAKLPGGTRADAVFDNIRAENEKRGSRQLAAARKRKSRLRQRFFVKKS